MKKKKGFFAEFKEFISRGSVIDLAVGIIIGGAFTAIVNSLVNDLIMPLFSLILGGLDFTIFNIPLGSGPDAPSLNMGTFIAAVVNFILIALVIFLLIKAINSMRSKVKHSEPEAAPTTKICPFCRSEISIDAVKCPYCTSDLPKKGASKR